jgi:hypothetical protein
MLIPIQTGDVGESQCGANLSTRSLGLPILMPFGFRPAVVLADLVPPTSPASVACPTNLFIIADYKPAEDFLFGKAFS